MHSGRWSPEMHSTHRAEYMAVQQPMRIQHGRACLERYLLRAERYIRIERDDCIGRRRNDSRVAVVEIGGSRIWGGLADKPFAPRSFDRAGKANLLSHDLSRACDLAAAE